MDDLYRTLFAYQGLANIYVFVESPPSNPQAVILSILGYPRPSAFHKMYSCRILETG
jgi:hypothetical protein